MYLEKLLLRNFRNFRAAELTLSPQVNLFLGNNGQGKTNLLEAIYLLSTGRSFRTRKLSELIFSGAKFFYIEGHFMRDGVSHFIKIYYDEHARKIQYDGTISSHFTCLLGVLPGVLISPEDHEIISGAPADRRRFFDIYLSQSDPLYIQYLSRYFGAMKQRNQLLRMKQERTLSAWEETMALAGSYLISKRKLAINTFQPLLSRWIQVLSLGQDPVVLKYAPSTAAESALELQQALHKLRGKELILGSTLIGPHKDEVDILLNDRKAKDFSSEGQKRSAMTAIRLAEWELLKETLDAPPILSIDDFGIQLDGTRQQALEEKIGNLGQVFLTAAKPLSLSPDLTVPIHQGTIQT